MPSRRSQTRNPTRPVDPNRTPEPNARAQIDALLDAAGWAVPDHRPFPPGADRSIVLRELPRESGPCDRWLPVDRVPVGVSAAKKAGTTRSAGAGQPGHHTENPPDFLAALQPVSFRNQPDEGLIFASLEATRRRCDAPHSNWRRAEATSVSAGRHSAMHCSTST